MHRLTFRLLTTLGVILAMLPSTLAAGWQAFSTPNSLSDPITLNQLEDNASAANSSPSLTNESASAIQISAGVRHTCALTASGGVKCWGFNLNGQLGDGTTTQRWEPVDVVGLKSGVKEISAGYDFSCALLDSGEVKCWGINDYGQLGDGTTTDRLTPVSVTGLSGDITMISAGYQHACILNSSGAVKCWGRNDSGQLGNGTTEDQQTPVDVIGLSNSVTAISAGGSHTCSLMTSGGVKCWGFNSYGALGDGTTLQRTEPVDVIGLDISATMVSAGSSQTCLLTSSGGVKCWGNNLYGQLGDGTTTNRLEPVDVIGLSEGIAEITSGGDFTCALTVAGGGKCWGINQFGQMGDGSVNTDWTHTIAVDVAGLITKPLWITSGGSHSCALLVTGGIQCWGWNAYGELGNGFAKWRAVPLGVIDLDHGYVSVSSGEAHACALNESGGLRCWGLNGGGRLGIDGIEQSDIPIDVEGLTSGVIQVSAPSLHTCALMETGGVKCWGSNFDGEVGDGTTINRYTPVDVINLSSNVTAISIGWRYSCALTTSGGIKCWGLNSTGQLGDGSVKNRLKPVDVDGLESGVIAISAGGAHACALLETGKVRCWGNNHGGQLGDGTNTDRLTPVDVVGLEDVVKSISAGAGYTCALMESGGIKCWGANYAGQLGNGSLLNSSTPVDVVGLPEPATQIATGSHNCALLTSGALYCWGADITGELGIGIASDAPHPIPQRVIGLFGSVVDVSAGYGFTCATMVSGEVKCWGNNTYGQLGDGTASFEPLPIDVTGFTLHTYQDRDTTFRPYPYGFSFCNGPSSSSCDPGWGKWLDTPYLYTNQEMLAMFGSQSVCASPDTSGCFPKWTAQLWNRYANQWLNAGHSAGMAAASLRFFTAQANPQDFHSGFDYAYWLDPKDRCENCGSEQSLSLGDTITSYQVKSLLAPESKMRADSMQRNTPSQILALLSQAFDGQLSDPPALLLQNDSAALALIPYGIQDQGDSLVWVRVYDSNWPGKSDRFVIINTDQDSWQYNLGSSDQPDIWQGDANSHSIGLVSLSTYDAAPICPWCGSASNQPLYATQTSQTWFSGAGHLLISDSQGRRIGFQNEQRVMNDIPGAYASTGTGGLGLAQEPIYTLPLTDTYRIQIQGGILTGTESASLAQFGPDFAVGLSGLHLIPNKIDQLSITPAGDQLDFIPDTDQLIDISLAHDTATGSQLLVLSNLEIAGANPISIHRIGSGELLELINSGTQDSKFNFKFQRYQSDGLQTFFHPQITLGSGAAIYLHLADWGGSADLLMGVDQNNDGLIDHELNLINFSQRTYLPLLPD